MIDYDEQANLEFLRMARRLQDPIADITASVAEAAGHAEGVSVLVVTPNEQMARLAGPFLARRLHPSTRFTDRVLHVEWMPAQGGYEVVVQVRTF